MNSENQNQCVDLTAEKKTGAPKRNYKKNEPKTVETDVVISKPKPRPKKEKQQPIETLQNDVGEETDYKKIAYLIDTNPDVAEEFQNIIKKTPKINILSYNILK